MGNSGNRQVPLLKITSKKNTCICFKQSIWNSKYAKAFKFKQISVYTGNMTHLKEADFSLRRHLKSVRFLCIGSGSAPGHRRQVLLKGHDSLKRNDHGTQPSPFQVLLDIVIAVELGQVDEHACGTSPISPAAVAAVAHPTTRRTDPGLQEGECGRGGYRQAMSKVVFSSPSLRHELFRARF